MGVAYLVNWGSQCWGGINNCEVLVFTNIKNKVKVVGAGPHQGTGVWTNPLSIPPFYNNVASQGKMDMFQVSRW